MSQRILIAGAGLAAGLAITFWCCGGRPDWTTDSPAALAAYERGRQAQMKFYAAEAAAAYRQALELDPEFVAARIGLLDTARLGREEREKLRAELRAADRSELNERERFLIDVLAADYDAPDARRQVVERYLERHPKDPWALVLAAGAAWDRAEWEKAERLYGELLESDPNWVLARNNLGYIAMAQGRFDEAEEQFRTYRYAAPDQANPHDSLGELYVLLGRYDEARAELEAALAARPDFCASYGNLFRLAVLERRPEDLPGVTRRIAANCPEEMVREFGCLEVIGTAFLGGDPNAPWTDPRCEERRKEDDILVHALALETGRLDEALAIEARLAAAVEKARGGNPRAHAYPVPALLLLEGQRLLAQGRPAEAAEKLREVDSATSWWGAGGAAVLRLVARLKLAAALEASGDAESAEEVRASLRAVNPAFARDWEVAAAAPVPPTPTPPG